MPNTLTRWDPFAEIADLRGRFDRVFRDLADGHEHPWTPAIDVVRDEEKIVVRADVPGMPPEDVKIEVEDEVLTVSGGHEERHEEKGTRFIRRERRYGAFSRSLALPAGIDPEQILAKTHDGVLEITIPLPAEGEKKAVTITPSAA